MRCMPSITRPSGPRMTWLDRSASKMRRACSTRLADRRRLVAVAEPADRVDLADCLQGNLFGGQPQGNAPCVPHLAAIADGETIRSRTAPTSRLGWAEFGSPPNSGLLRTTDGGVTWHQVRFARPR